VLHASSAPGSNKSDLAVGALGCGVLWGIGVVPALTRHEVWAGSRWVERDSGPTADSIEYGLFNLPILVLAILTCVCALRWAAGSAMAPVGRWGACISFGLGTALLVPFTLALLSTGDWEGTGLSATRTYLDNPPSRDVLNGGAVLAIWASAAGFLLSAIAIGAGAVHRHALPAFAGLGVIVVGVLWLAASFAS